MGFQTPIFHPDFRFGLITDPMILRTLPGLPCQVIKVLFDKKRPLPAVVPLAQLLINIDAEKDEVGASWKKKNKARSIAKGLCKTAANSRCLVGYSEGFDEHLRAGIDEGEEFSQMLQHVGTIQHAVFITIVDDSRPPPTMVPTNVGIIPLTVSTHLSPLHAQELANDIDERAELLGRKPNPLETFPGQPERFDSIGVALDTNICIAKHGSTEPQWFECIQRLPRIDGVIPEQTILELAVKAEVDEEKREWLERRWKPVGTTERSSTGDRAIRADLRVSERQPVILVTRDGAFAAIVGSVYAPLSKTLVLLEVNESTKNRDLLGWCSPPHVMRTSSVEERVEALKLYLK